MTEKPDDPLAGLLSVSINRLCEITSISRGTVYNEAKAGRLKLSKLAGRTVIMVPDVRAWLALSSIPADVTSPLIDGETV